jgi:predicted CoA-substrate-specific enzyme activase
MQAPQYFAGIDAGSVTLKLVICSSTGEILFHAYERHLCDPMRCLSRLLARSKTELGDFSLKTLISGSAGFLVAQTLALDHLQEVFAAGLALRYWAPEVRTVIELGGEDAKIIFFGPPVEQRMNGTCAGGTGAFIDQMASLLKISPMELDNLAGGTRTHHPIASRCGVFAKSDVQGLLSRGIPLPEAARSVMQAVVLQTISGLGFGKRIQGPLAYLGGPFHHLPVLKACFTDHLKLDQSDLIPIQHDLYAVAYGCMLSARSQAGQPFRPVASLISRIEQGLTDGVKTSQNAVLPPLGADNPKPAFITAAPLPDVSWEKAQGPFFLGIDCGSTTTKLCLTDSRDRIVFHRYRENGPSALTVAVALLTEMWTECPPGIEIARSGATGYGEPLFKAALGIDSGEVETLAHTRAALSLHAGVDTILDIGGQDMKTIRLAGERIESIVLNEACSSGCGTFLQTFAGALDLSLSEFSRLGLEARHPADLGTRCTVFMNSKIKEAQRDGVGRDDLSAGLAYSVVRNALYKVLKLSSPEKLGRTVVVQGGTFRNEAVLMALARETGAHIIRPDQPELMGAYGMALLAREQHGQGPQKSRLISPQALKTFSVQTSHHTCLGCTNHCDVTRFTFPDGARFQSGHRCGHQDTEGAPPKTLPNLFRYKKKRLFDYTPLSLEEAPRGSIGLPRVLNIYEHYPFWFTLLTRLGFRVQLSPPSQALCPHEGWEYLSSEAICYPAKLVYAHILALVNMGVKRIFFPCLPREEGQDGRDFRYNCPIVTSFPQVIRANLDPLRSQGVRFDDPFLPIHHRRSLWKHLQPLFSDPGINSKNLRQAVAEAYRELDRYRSDLLTAGQEALHWLDEHPQTKGVVLAGRPYHLDEELNHGIPEMIEALGVAVISEDALPEQDFDPGQSPLRVIDQWTYHHRLYNAARVVTRRRNLDMVQLNSFGCGLDAVTSDQVEEILKSGSKALTLLKIDENSQLGAARIRLRSLFSAPARIIPPAPQGPLPGRKAPRPPTTILMPQMSPIHFTYLEQAFLSSGHPVELLPEPNAKTVETGLRHANHDICYPAIILIGQLIEALRSGRYQPEAVTLLLSQTGGGCRASNYVALLERALTQAGFPEVPILTLAGSARTEGPAIRYTLKLIKRIILSQTFGDLEQRLRNRFFPYIGEAFDAILSHHRPGLLELIEHPSQKTAAAASRKLCREFIPYLSLPRRPRVGVVGEIFIKYNALGNNHLVASLEREGCEVVLPDIVGFAEYCAYDRIANQELLGESRLDAGVAGLFISLIEKYRRHGLSGLSLLCPDEPTHHPVSDLARLIKPFLSTGNQCGEGWYLTAEMASMMETGIDRIVCVQPFGCLANHISGRGMMKPLRQIYPRATILPLDYDPGSSAVNQYNRLKLFLGNWGHEEVSRDC